MDTRYAGSAGFGRVPGLGPLIGADMVRILIKRLLEFSGKNLPDNLTFDLQAFIGRNENQFGSL